jgi:hypothetical protein
MLTQSESRVEHAARRQHENASKRGIRGGLPLQLGAWIIPMPLIVRCRRQNDRRASESVPSRRRIFRPSMNSGRA